MIAAAMKYVALGLVLLAVSARAEPGEVIPNHPNCPEMQGPLPHYFIHPTNCSRFYECHMKDAWEYECPAGLHFNVAIDVCDFPVNAKCESQSPGDQTTTTLRPTTTTLRPTTTTTTDWITTTTTEATTTTTFPTTTTTSAPTTPSQWTDPTITTTTPIWTDPTTWSAPTTTTTWSDQPPPPPTTTTTVWIDPTATTTTHAPTTTTTWSDLPPPPPTTTTTVWIDPTATTTTHAPTTTTTWSDLPPPPPTTTTTTVWTDPTTTTTTDYTTAYPPTTNEPPSTPHPTDPHCPPPGATLPNYWAHGTDCSRYYGCLEGCVKEFKCPDGLYWNDQQKRCDSYSSSQCGCPDIPPAPNMWPSMTSQTPSAKAWPYPKP
ncbi:salivary glue protein Sgs-3 [Anopheles gambiae]|uniref:Chitin-binding type-2 domain-containing protein n=1 Tax=Anopheles coluzzii TaxID=1518534 RepID=A0A6E8VPL4_ANOCL|nr:salivary glue protein Sgs-3 [Anopheles gambiae]XP_040241212.2 salivary glue protein Sgs-3-like [Anopheles coluzzii]